MGVENIKKNCMGTISFDGKFKGMRKYQDFIVYPLDKNNDALKIKIQSDTRIGYIKLDDGKVIMSKSISSGAYFQHLTFAKHIDTLSKEELSGLKFRLFLTSGESVGNNAIRMTTDNSSASKISIF